jgi:hypothetical protein
VADPARKLSDRTLTAHLAGVADQRRCHTNLDGFPAPTEGLVITHVLVVADQDRSREFYRSLLGGQVLLERDHGREIRAYIRDPDGHLIEVGQATGLLD